MKFGTQVIHAGIQPEPNTGAIMTPIFQTSTYVQSAPTIHKGYEYARTQNPTRSVLETNLSSLEEAKYARCFASGMAAIDAVLKLLKSGDKILANSDLYGGTYRIFTRIFTQYGLKFEFVDMQTDINQYIDKETKMLWLETPTNPLMRIINIKHLAKICKANDITFVVDNTFASPFIQRPLNLGANIVVHSITKYLAGHSDVVMGVALTNDSEVEERLAFIQNACGAVPGPQDCFLTLRGIKTLNVRMERHCQNGMKVAKYLQNHSKIAKVYYPGLESHLNHEIAKKQMNGQFGGMLSFTFKNDKLEVATNFLKNLKIFALAESLGGVESLAEHPASMTHGSIPKTQREKIGLLDSLIRLSVGIEDIEDLIFDLDQAILKI